MSITNLLNHKSQFLPITVLRKARSPPIPIVVGDEGVSEKGEQPRQRHDVVEPVHGVGQHQGDADALKRIGLISPTMTAAYA